MMGAGYTGKKAMSDSRRDWFYRRCVGWQLKFSWLPRRCYISNQRIWLQYAYKGTSVLTGPGDSIIDHRWHRKDEHLIWKIKGN